MKRPPRQLAIQHELVDRNLRLADTGIGRAVIANSKQTAQQLQAQGNAQGAQRAGMIEGKLHAGYQQEANRWLARPTRPQGSSSAPRPASKPAPRPGQKPVSRPAQPQPPRPAPAAGRPVQRPPAPVSRPNSFAQGQPIRQHGPVAAPPMSYQPGRVNNQTQMQQVQPIARPPMHVNHSSQSSVHNHYQTTHVHAPPNPHAPPPPGPIVQNNSTYYNYSYEEHTAPPRSHSPPSSNIGLAAGAGLVGGATLLYVTYEPSDNGDSYSDGNQWEDDPDLYIDDINMTEDDWNDQVSYTSDNLDSYGNDPSAYPADAGNTWDSQAPDPGYSAVAPGGGYSSGGDYSGGGGGSGAVAIVTIVATVMVVVVMAVVTVVETMMIAVKWITYGFLL
ncbi:hypothetical protein FS749_010381 [Ceratobasidium sp. UAMH 11750]|nr:hypothetical protein FS749_010381 [Ceratobasidium sp. UAMH 11750]